MAEVNIDVALESSVQELLTLMSQGVTANVVKSVQRGYVSVDSAQVTININEVNLNKAILISNGNSVLDNNAQYSNGEEPHYWSTSLALTDSTTITAVRCHDSGTTTVIHWQVIEFY